LYQRLLKESDDPAVLGTIAAALADSTLGYDQRISDASGLRAAKEKLQLPEHNEALQSIEAALARLEGRKPAAVKNAFNHPIDWAVVKQIPEDQHATIRTSRGNILLKLHVGAAPG